MIVYTVTLLLITILGSLEYKQRLADTYYYEDGYVYQKKNNFYFFLILVVFLCVGGFRYQVGSDFGAYYKFYNATWSEVLMRFRTFDEPLIYLLTNICRSIWNDGIFVIFIENAITVLLVFKGIRDWEDESWTMQLLLYILYCGWTGSFNGVRQALAGAVIFAFSKQAERKWILRYAIVCLVAFLIHKTAIFMFPVLILANRRIEFRQVAAITGAAFAMPYIGSYALNFIGDSLSTDYAVHAVNIIRVIVAAIPVSLIILSTAEYRNENKFLINMAIFNVIITFSTRNNALMYRFADYTNMYLMLFIPKSLCFVSGNLKKLIQVIVVLMYLIYFAVEVNSGNGNLNNFQWAFSHFGEW